MTHGVESVGGDDSVVSSLRVTLGETQRVVVGGVHLDAMAVEVLAKVASQSPVSRAEFENPERPRLVGSEDLEPPATQVPRELGDVVGGDDLVLRKRRPSLAEGPRDVSLPPFAPRTRARHRACRRVHRG